MLSTDKTESYSNFLGQLANLRNMVGVTLEALAKKANSSKSTASRKLSGNNLDDFPSWDYLHPMVELLLKDAARLEFKSHEVGNVDSWRRFWLAAARGEVIPSPLEGEESRRRSRIAVLDSPGVMETLRAIYPKYPLVELWGVTMPICEFPAQAREYGDVESSIGTLLDSQIPGWEEYSPEFNQGVGKSSFRSYVARYRDSGSEEDRKRFFPGPAYALHEMRRDATGRLVIDFKMGRYFTSLATSERLDTEMMTALAPNPDHLAPLSRLPQRSWLHSMVSDPVVDGRRRAAAVSHATVIAAATDSRAGGYDIILPSRSGSVATHAHFNHVAPSGIFAPFDEHNPPPPEEFSVRRNFYREWVEELYSIEWHQRPNSSLAVPDPEDEPEIARLRDMINTGKGSLYYTGISVNLLTMRPEICLLLLIRDPKWLREEGRVAHATGRPSKLSWEYSEGPWQGVKLPGQSDHWQFGLTADLQPRDRNPLKPTFLIPNAGAAISLALKAMQALKNS